MSGTAKTRFALPSWTKSFNVHALMLCLINQTYKVVSATRSLRFHWVRVLTLHAGPGSDVLRIPLLEMQLSFSKSYTVSVRSSRKPLSVKVKNKSHEDFLLL